MHDLAKSIVDMSRQPGERTCYILNTLSPGRVPQFEVEVLRADTGARVFLGAILRRYS